ncbi:hypothetical protein [Microbacterium sp. RURRCA19A]|uniref:hypothetical protein n=1 Tax=Microbacterium sp. RURRCA19A TaxID=1907391 RepID=UPI0009704505|nr:hypothetical protein [Microbacterium sp. RURRCA19A]
MTTATLLVTDVENLGDVVAHLRAAAADLGCGLTVRTLAGDEVDESDAAAAARRDRERKRLPIPVRVDLHALSDGPVDAEAVLRGARARGLRGGATVDEVRHTGKR